MFRAFARAAADHGFTGVATAPERWSQDAWISAARLADEARTLTFLLALRPGLMPPALGAQLADTYQRLSGGRVLLHVVADDEPGAGGAGDPRRADAFLGAIARYRADADLAAAAGAMGRSPDFPPVYLGGYSPAALEVAARHADVCLLPARPRGALRRALDRARALAERAGRRPAFGTRLHVVTRDTELEARRHAGPLIAGTGPRGRRLPAAAPARAGAVPRAPAGTAPGRALPRPAARPGEGAAVLVGSHRQVADRIAEYADAGITHFVLSGDPALEEVHHFGAGVLPLLGERGLWRPAAAAPAAAPR
nr:LLM class flavin-dependent oxidoreductase [Streptomonospora nanhaiensis]